MQSNNKLTVIGLVAVVVIAIGVLFFFLNKSGGAEGASDVQKIQAEAKADVPKGLPTVPPELATAGTHTMGGGAGGTGKGPGKR